MIGFIGHHDCLTTDQALDRIAAKFPEETWMHGGAETGLEKQVADYCARHKIRTVVAYPIQKGASFREALNWSRQAIVSACEQVYVCCDEREQLEVYRILKLAQSLNTPVIFLSGLEEE